MTGRRGNNFCNTLLVASWRLRFIISGWSHIVGSDFRHVRHLLPVYQLRIFSSVILNRANFRNTFIVASWPLISIISGWSHIVVTDFRPAQHLLPVYWTYLQQPGHFCLWRIFKIFLLLFDLFDLESMERACFIKLFLK